MHLRKPPVGKKEVTTSACIVMLSLTACKSGGGGSLGGLGGGIGASTSSSPSGGGMSSGSLSGGRNSRGSRHHGHYSGGSLSSEETSSKTRYSYSEEDAARRFIIKNYAQLKVQAARGEGELLDALLELILDDEADVPKMARRLQKYNKRYFQKDKQAGADRILARAEKYNA